MFPYGGIVDVDNGDEFWRRWCVVVVERGGVVGVDGGEGVTKDVAVGIGKGFITDKKERKKKYYSIG